MRHQQGFDLLPSADTRRTCAWENWKRPRGKRDHMCGFDPSRFRNHLWFHWKLRRIYAYIPLEQCGWLVQLQIPLRCRAITLFVFEWGMGGNKYSRPQTQTLSFLQAFTLLFWAVEFWIVFSSALWKFAAANVLQVRYHASVYFRGTPMFCKMCCGQFLRQQLNRSTACELQCFSHPNPRAPRPLPESMSLAKVMGHGAHA